MLPRLTSLVTECGIDESVCIPVYLIVPGAQNLRGYRKPRVSSTECPIPSGGLSRGQNFWSRSFSGSGGQNQHPKMVSQ